MFFFVLFYFERDEAKTVNTDTISSNLKTMRLSTLIQLNQQSGRAGQMIFCMHALLISTLLHLS